MKTNTQIINEFIAADNARMRANKLCKEAKEELIQALKANAGTLEGVGVLANLKDHTRRTVNTQALKDAGIYDKYSHTSHYQTIETATRCNLVYDETNDALTHAARPDDDIDDAAAAAVLA